MKDDTLLDIMTTSRILLNKLETEEELSPQTIDNIRHCGEGFMFFICKNDPRHRVEIRKKHCNWKYCPNCIEKVGNKRMFRLKRIIKQFKEKRMMTLAYKNISYISREAINDYLKQYYALIRLLRNRGLIRHYVRVLEIKKIGLTYNFHIHIVYEGSYIPVHWLSEQFRKVTKGESYIVDIRRIGWHNNTNSFVANYLGKYLTKLPQIYPKEAFYDVYLAFRNVRMFQSSLRLKIPKFKASCPICGGEVECYVYSDISMLEEVRQAWRDTYSIDDYG